MKKVSALRIPVYAIHKKHRPMHGMTRTDFGYITQLVGEKKDGSKYLYFWLADIEEDVIENPESFQIDPSPCGSRMTEDEAANFSKQENNWQIGYIQDGKLFITDSVNVETAWSSDEDRTLHPTKLRRIGEFPAEEGGK